jgi:hypothetical protein
MHICVDLVKLGLELRFNNVSQRLELIRVYDLSLIDLQYQGRTVSVRETAPCFSDVHQLFGPTTAGSYSENKLTYRLHYPGITFLFTIPEKYNIDGLENIKDGRMPEYKSVVLNCIYIFVPDDHQPDRIKEMKPLGFPNHAIVVNPSQGISINTESLRFGDSPQDVLTILGPQQYISYKISDPLSIHKPDIKQNQYQYDYFYNYFEMGLDILFDAVRHNIKKFILHTNFPTQRNFNLYRKCHYVITPPQHNNNNDRKEDQDNSDDERIDNRLVTPEMKWSEIVECYGNNVMDPFIYPSTKDNPFGALKYFAYQDIIYEVMDNGYVSTVILFKM